MSRVIRFVLKKYIFLADNSLYIFEAIGYKFSHDNLAHIVEQGGGEKIGIGVTLSLQALEDSEGMRLLGGGHTAEKGYEAGGEMGGDGYVGDGRPGTDEGELKLADSIGQAGEESHDRRSITWAIPAAKAGLQTIPPHLHPIGSIIFGLAIESREPGTPTPALLQGGEENVLFEPIIAWARVKCLTLNLRFPYGCLTILSVNFNVFWSKNA